MNKGYIWKLVRRKRLWSSDLNELDYFNFPCCREKSGYRNLLQIKEKINDYRKDYKLKLYHSNWLWERNPYNDTLAQAWLERKSWKRNSKRKHQWKRNF